uniref:Uncharacterized protein n=1 Tax=viral metagenome TaxID=1070528 RepID=A0A6H1Z7P7_9ZZZZ
MTKEESNEERQRVRIARYLLRCLDELGIPLERVAADLKIRMPTLLRLQTSAPQFRVLYPVGRYVSMMSIKQDRLLV